MKNITVEELFYMDFEIQRLEERIRNGKGKFSSDDIRGGLIYAFVPILRAYYYRCNFLYLSTSMKGNHAESLPEEYKPQFYKIFQLPNNREYYDNYCHISNRSILIDSWSMFEFAITIMCNFILNAEEQARLTDEKFNRAMKILKDVKIELNRKEELKNLISPSNLTHVSINGKYNKLFKRTIQYSRVIEDDKVFLEFYGKFRNSHHSNFIYNGNDRNYKILDIDFVFENNKVVRNKQPYNYKYHFMLAIELLNIFNAICNAIDYEGFIPYPIEHKNPI